MLGTIKSLAGLVGLLWLAAAFFQVGQINAAAPRQADSAPQSAAVASSSTPLPDRALLDRYCVGCHNDRTKTAGLSLQTIDAARMTADNAPAWEKVARKLRSGAMPPAGRPRPDKVTSHGLAASIEHALDSAAAAAPNPGSPAIHRLNRAEYTNVVRDLLALEIDGRSLLPSDDAAHGFDNIGDFLSVSPSLLERYLFAARKIAYRAVGDTATPAVVETYGLSPYFEQHDRMSEELPFGTRGGLSIRHHFPVDGEYMFRVRLKRGEVSRILGLAEQNQIDLRLDGSRLTQFTIGGEPPVPAAASENNVPNEEKAESALNLRVSVKAGTRHVGVTLLNKKSVLEGLRPAGLSTFFGGGGFGSARGAMGIEGIVIEGPFNVSGLGDTPSRRRIFVCRPARSQDQKPCADQILRTLARRAYRRAATSDDVETLMTFYKAGRAKGGFEAGIRSALERLLVEPDFLFRVENDPAQVPPGVAFRLSGFEIASRLSFFLWSSIPDDELLDLAERDRLKDAGVLDQQVRRMLADSRSYALVNNFAAQWLFLRNVQAAKPDRYAFPEFDENLREAFQRETEVFVESQLREDRSLVELLTANYTFVNERLASHYGIPGVYGSRFRRVTFSDDRRAGLLGHGSILMVTSYPNRTSPVLRGKWLLENILGAPPPPAPPNVPPLEENDEGGGKVLTMRERMEQHRKNPVCASCHALMDPFGLALENFDAIGRWRTAERGSPIDSSATLADGVTIQGPSSLRQVFVGRREEFVTAFTEKLLTYALGRGIEYYDKPAIRRIVREAAADDYRWSAIVLGIAKSIPFQMRLRRSES